MQNRIHVNEREMSVIAAFKKLNPKKSIYSRQELIEAHGAITQGKRTCSPFFIAKNEACWVKAEGEKGFVRNQYNIDVFLLAAPKKGAQQKAAAKTKGAKVTKAPKTAKSDAK